MSADSNTVSQAYAPPPQSISPQVVMMPPAPLLVGPQSTEAKWPKVLIGTGIAQVSIGSVCALIGIIQVVVIGGNRYGTIGHPIWCGLLFFLVAGIFGILSGWRKSSLWGVCYLLISSYSCAASLVLIGISALSLSYPYFELVVATDAIVIILALAELTIAIISVVLTSKFFFCSRPATQNIPQFRYQPGLPQQQMAGNYYQSQVAQGYHATTQPQVGYTTQPLPSATAQAEAPPTGQNPIN